jgi:flagellar hook-associated protein 3 FlgL
MIERITPLMTSAQILANINSLQDQLDHTQQELSTGRTINQPSDNPYGASLAISLSQDLSSLNSYANDVTDGTAWASAASTALQSIQSMVQRVQELTVEAANGSMSPTDLRATAAEVNQLIDAIKQTADTQYNGQYIFSGTATQTAPYSSSTGDVYQGNNGSVLRQIGPGAQLQVNVDISSLLGSGQGAGDGLLLDTLRTIASDMQGATTADVADLSANQIANLQGNVSVLEQLQANVGAVQDRLQLASTRIQALQTSDTAALSNDEDANIASTYTTFSNEQAAFTAALKAGASIVQSSLMDFLTG